MDLKKLDLPVALRLLEPYEPTMCYIKKEKAEVEFKQEVVKFEHNKKWLFEDSFNVYPGEAVLQLIGRAFKMTIKNKIIFI